MTQRLVPVVAAVIEDDGRYLVCQRPHDKEYGGLWEFPGGKRCPDESDADALARELREELGVRVESVGRLLDEVVDSRQGIAVRFFFAKISGQIDLREHLNVRWSSPLDLESLPLAPSDAEFVGKFWENDV